MKLHLFTSTYPYGFGESFINNELPYLLEEFEEVVIYPVNCSGEVQSSFDPSILVDFDKGRENYKLSIGDKFYLLKVLLKEFSHTAKRGFFLKRFRLFYATLKKGLQLAHWLKQKELQKEDVFYSFWMNEWALALALLKDRWNGPNFVFRVNGRDIHDERHEGNYLPFRWFIYSKVDRVIAVSKTARDYIRNLNVFPEKIHHSYFGTKDLGPSPEIKKEKFIVFSCSTALPLKRVPKIAQSLVLLDFPVKWAHHGDGVGMEEVKSVMDQAPEHIEFKNTVRLSDYYKVLEMERNLCPDLFINLSSTEGLPVTVMEALSFGTPVLLNDVGSCKELVTEKTGVLVSKDASPEEVAEEIKKLRASGIAESGRNDIRNFWIENFSAERNYSYFAKQLKNGFESA